MESRKSIFEKIGLVEKVPTKPDVMGDTPEKQKEVEVMDEYQTSQNTTSKSDRFFEITEIYDKHNLRHDGLNTIYIVDSFLKALPEYLPDDIRRQSLYEIIASSGMQLENLLNDGNSRVKLLKTFLDEFSNNTRKSIEEYEKEIDMLNARINQYKKAITEAKKLHENQKSSIEYETQKISNIINFINPTR